MNWKRFLVAGGVTVLTLVMIWGGWSTARFLFGTTLDEETAPMDQVSATEERVNILCLGLDQERIRSDVIMLVSIDPKYNTVSILSLPRDTQVHVNGKTIKLNETMSYERREELLISKVKELTGVPVHYYAEIDFQGFIDVIDILGGVDFNVPYKMDYDDPTQNLHIHFTPGMQHLDGQKAHDFVRFRHNNDNSAPGPYAMGDTGRVQAQQEFLKALFEQKLKPQYITKAPQILDEVYKHLRTNMSIADMMGYLPVLQNLSADSLHTFQLPGESRYENNLWYHIYDPEETDALVEQYFLSTSVPPSPSASVSASASPAA